MSIFGTCHLQAGHQWPDYRVWADVTAAWGCEYVTRNWNLLELDGWS